MRNGMSAARRVAIPHHYERGLQTKAGKPVEGTELRQQTFETVIIERYRRRERAH